MTTTTHKTHHEESAPLRVIILLSAWGFALVVTSFMFLWLGHLVDELLGTSPKFMLGLFFLALIGCFIELYQEVWKIMKEGHL